MPDDILSIPKTSIRSQIAQHSVFPTPSGEHVDVWTLLGEGAPDLQVVHTVSGARASGAITRGGAPKTYGTATSNEDAVLVAEGPRGLVLAVADAHAGPEASEWAIRWLAATRVRQWLTRGASRQSWCVEAMDLFFSVNSYLLQQNVLHSTQSRTTLALAFLDDAKGMVLAASAGDSHVYGVGRSEALAVARGAGAGEFFLGLAPASQRAIAEACAADVIHPSAEVAMVLTTDGLSTQGIGFPNTAAVVHEVVTSTPRHEHPDNWSAAVAEALARRGCEVQKANHAGDDIGLVTAGVWKPTREWP